jgi:hypothetical protein
MVLPISCAVIRRTKRISAGVRRLQFCADRGKQQKVAFENAGFYARAGGESEKQRAIYEKW